MLEKLFDAAFEKALELAAGATIGAAVEAFDRRGKAGSPAHGGRLARMESFTEEKIAEMARTPWGPQRATVDAMDPFGYAPSPSFNCDFNNPNYGDERVVCLIKPASHKGSGGWGARIKVSEGDYLVRVYYHNSSDPTRVAKNARIHAIIPDVVSKISSITCCISASNASPLTVWSNVVLASDFPFRVEYVQGSSLLSTNKDVSRRLADGVSMPSGQLIGWEVDGRVPGGYNHDGILSFHVRVTPAVGGS